jgi:hypothetical protein
MWNLRWTKWNWPDILHAFRPFLANQYSTNAPFSSTAVPGSACGRAPEKNISLSCNALSATILNAHQPSRKGKTWNWNINIRVFLELMPCSLLDGYQRFGGPCCLHIKMEAAGSSETRVPICQLKDLIFPGILMQYEYESKHEMKTIKQGSWHWGSSSLLMTSLCNTTLGWYMNAPNYMKEKQTKHGTHTEINMSNKIMSP